MEVETLTPDEIFTLVHLAILKIIDDLDHGLFYFDCNGQPLFKLDQVIVAIEDGRWPVDGQVNGG